MQTFLPYDSFQASAESLDVRRLGKQRVETLQLVRGQWPNHPAAKMWHGFKDALALYGIVICHRWRSLGYNDTCLLKILEEVPDIDISNVKYPPWFGDTNFHKSHQSNLVRKLPDHYRQFFPDVPDDLPYVWPVS